MSIPNSRLLRTHLYQPVDRVPDIEFGFWPQTLRRWVAEGFPKAWADEIGDACFHPYFEEFIGTDEGQKLEDFARIPIRTQIDPPFEERTLAEDDATVTVRDASGTVLRRWKSLSANASIPEYLEFPVKDRATWENVKARYRIGDPARSITDTEIAHLRQVAADGWMITTTVLVGFYGALRNWVGVENLSYLFYDDPELVDEMAEHWAQLILAQLRQLPADVPCHMAAWWEDMSYNHGPLCSVDQFHNVIVPRYKLIMSELQMRGCQVALVDSDGNISKLVPGWLRSGINVMFPLEVAAGTDPFELRKLYGKQVGLQGGIDKRPLALGRDAINRELDRIAPLLAQGGYVPCLDHLVPPDVSLENYMYYRRQKKLLIGKS